MKIEQSHIEEIRVEFARMQTRQDLLNLLNKVKPWIYGEKCVAFELKQLTWYANPKLATKRYTKFAVRKKSGSERIIHAPVPGLKALQKTLSVILQCVFDPHTAATGFVRNKSIVDNARMHVGKRYVYNIDLKDFFPSIDQARVWKCLQLKPFALTEKVNESNESTMISPTYKLMLGTKHYAHPKKKSEQILRFDYKGFIFLPGFRKLPLKSGEHIFYSISLSELENRGTIELYLDRSSYEIIKQAIRKEYPDQETDLSSLSTAFLQLIELHQKKLREKDNRGKLANTLAALCCTEMDVERMDDNHQWEMVKKNVLPQGAPTSPVITNIICQKLDFLLTGVAKRFGLTYSRYADDITFSSMHNIYQPESDFIKELNRIITEQGFHIKESKTRLQKDGYRKEVTGLLVNEKVNVQKRYIKQLRMWLYFWERYGYEKASEYFNRQYLSDKGHIKAGKADMANVIRGKLDYLKMVKGQDNSAYLHLKRKVDVLSNIETKKIYVQPEITINTTSVSNNIIEKNDPSLIKPSSINQDTIPFLHDPLSLVALLSKFSDNDNPLKYSCHSWDFGKVEGVFEGYTDFIDKYDNKGRQDCFKIQKIKSALGTKILHFLNTINENGEFIKKGEQVKYSWGEHEMRYGWKSKELSTWAIANPDKDPFDFPLPKKKIIKKRNEDIEIAKFGDVVKIFKEEIEIRPEDSALYNLFAELRRKRLGFDFKVNIDESLKGKQFYTDVHSFKRALNKIFDEISKRRWHPNISITAENYPTERYTLVSILHEGSLCKDKSTEEMISEVKDGDFGDILKYLYNICDWSIESEFQDGKYRINYLTSNESESKKNPIESVLGFKHIFKFYKS